MHCERQFKDGYGNGASLSIGSLQGKPGGRAPLLGTLKDKQRKALEPPPLFNRGPAG
jgi:hypothetical protein